MAEMLRLFVAVKTSAEIQSAAAPVIARLKESGAEVSWVKPENLHFTLKFLGDVPADRVGEISAALSKIRASKFGLEIASVGALPNEKKPRVIYAGCGAGAEALRGLAAGVERELETLGFKREQREFLAHLTIGRVKGSKNLEKLAKKIDFQTGVIFGKLSVVAISLYKSDLNPRGPEYTILAEMPLD